MHCTHQMAVDAGRGPQTAVALGGVTESRMPFIQLLTVQTNRQEMEKKKRDKQKSECQARFKMAGSNIL